MAKQAFQRVDASAPVSVTKFSKRGCSKRNLAEWWQPLVDEALEPPQRRPLVSKRRRRSRKSSGTNPTGQACLGSRRSSSTSRMSWQTRFDRPHRAKCEPTPGTRHTGRFCGQTVLCDAYAGPPLQPRPIWMDLLRLQHFLAIRSGRAGLAAIRPAPLPPKAHACVEVWCPGCDVYSTRRSPFDPGRELGQTITLGRIAFDTTVTAPVPHFGEQSPSKPR